MKDRTGTGRCRSSAEERKGSVVLLLVGSERVAFDEREKSNRDLAELRLVAVRTKTEGQRGK